MIFVFVPSAFNDKMKDCIMQSWKKQTIPNKIIFCQTEGQKQNSGWSMKKIICEINSRKLIQSIIKEKYLSEKYIITADIDKLNLQNDNIKRAIDFLDNNYDYNAVSLANNLPLFRIDNTLKHIDIGWVMYRTNAYLSLNFDEILNNRKQMMCLCESVTAQIRKLGKFNYLDTNIHVKHLTKEI